MILCLWGYADLSTLDLEQSSGHYGGAPKFSVVYPYREFRYLDITIPPQPFVPHLPDLDVNRQWISLVMERFR